MKTFSIKTFGCQMNKDDSERITGLLVSQGFAPSTERDQADILIYNTCCVRENADDKLYGQVGALKQLKNGRPDLIIAVGGCLAQREGERLREKLPHVDVVFGTHNIARLPLLLSAAETAAEGVCELVEGSADFTADLPAVRAHQWHAWLPIAVGCDNFCTYCIVPYVRGREKSRPLDALLKTCADLVEDGVKEVTLLGQNVNSYGRDIYGTPRFADLLVQVAAVDGLERVRFTTSHPKDLGVDIVEAVAAHPNLCPHFHLPLQAGSDKILKRMHRQYTAEQYLRTVGLIREKVAGVSITTDIMVGFPGESDEDFQQTLDVVGEARFDQAFTFVYSPRPGTAAAQYADQVPADVVGARFDRLIDVQQENSFSGNKGLVGKKLPVFIESLSKKSRYRLAARTWSNKLVHLDGPDRLIGQTLDVEIKEAFSWFLIGEATALVSDQT